MYEVSKETMKTPIEIALGIDENGMTTARKLYEWLELNPSNYARWCKSNITENEFAEENVDYWAFFLNEEWGGQSTVDYKLTAHFAKKLSCKGNGKPAEDAREYFTKIEEKTKEIVVSRSKLSQNTQLLFGILESIANQELEQQRQAEQIARLEQKQESIKEAVEPIRDNWRQEIQKKINRIQKSTGRPHNLLRAEIYKTLEDRAGCDLETRLNNKRNRMRRDGSTVTAINKTNYIDVIAEDVRIKEIFEKIVTEYEIKYC